MIIEDTGWYEEKKNGKYKFVASNKEEMIEYLDNEGLLNDAVTEFICSEFDMEDFIREKMRGCEYMNREDLIDCFMNEEIEEGKYFSCGGRWMCWFEEGEDTETD